MDQIEANPGLPVRALQEQLQSTYGVSISEEKAFRAKALATKNVAGDYVKQYAALRDYVLELQKTNEGTIVKIDVRVPYEESMQCDEGVKQVSRSINSNWY
uniref:Uncharacterized protein n=1 Tax=Lactuca sativa TaxID=4236 RepID=A0A9R1UPH1_LACSA|nr:hypothetical protein LSAT_V11C800421900 [Lactuca sativa]